MLRVLIFSFFWAIVWGSGFKEIVKQKCTKLFDGETLVGPSCCVMEFPQQNEPAPKEMQVTLQDCSKLPIDSPNCEHDKCVAARYGLIDANGNLDKTKLDPWIENVMVKDDKIIAAIKEKCVHGDLSPYGSENECEFRKIDACATVQLFGNCPKWNNEGQCKGMQEAAAECLKQFP